MKESVKLERALQSLPYEILYLHTGGEACEKMFNERLELESSESELTKLQLILNWSMDALDSYDNGGDNRHINFEMKEDDPDAWRKERNEIKSYIRRIKGYLK